MVSARDLGGWLQGPGTRRGPDGTPVGGPGDREAGLQPPRPPEGPGSVAGFGRRVVGLVVDWACALLIAAGVLQPLDWGSLAPLVVLFVMHTVLVATAGAGIGHRLAGLRVEQVSSPATPPDLPRSALRALLLCLAVPPLITDRTGRGLHDRAAGTVVVRRG